MPTPQVPFFLKNRVLEEAHHSWAQYSIYTAKLAVNFHRKPWMVNWSWRISFGPESSTMCRTRSVTQKSTSCDMLYSMPCGRRKEEKMFTDIFRNNNDAYYYLTYASLLRAHFHCHETLTHINQLMGQLQ